MSKEHVFSRAVFRKMPRKTMLVKGLHNIPDGPVGSDFPASRMLCRKHNSQLSRLDSEAGKLAAAVHRFHEGIPSQHVQVNGLLLERWALKTTINHMAAGFGDHSKWLPGADVVRIIYGLEAPPDRCGLYSLALDNYLPLASEQVGITPAWRGSPEGPKQLVGAVVYLHGAAFFASFSTTFVDELETNPITSDPSSFQLTKSRLKYRPPLMVMTGELGQQLFVLFDWA